MHGTLKRLHGAARGTGTTIERFRLNEVASQLAFGGRRRASPTMTFAVGGAQDLDLPDSSFDIVISALAIHHIPARKRAAALREMYRVTKPGGRLLVADFGPARRPLALHTGGRRMRRAAATAGPLDELAATAGYQVQSAGQLPLLRYVLAIRPEHDATT
jgi:ubiquinone/menaquinone biosynthesis C-methylase UbiE